MKDVTKTMRASYGYLAKLHNIHKTNHKYHNLLHFLYERACTAEYSGTHWGAGDVRLLVNVSTTEQQPSSGGSCCCCCGGGGGGGGAAVERGSARFGKTM
jgi:hypothetical protein